MNSNKITEFLFENNFTSCIENHAAIDAICILIKSGKMSRFHLAVCTMLLLQIDLNKAREIVVSLTERIN